MITEAVWSIDEYQCWNFYVEHEGRKVHAFIQKRPAYCDRGHWSFNVDGIPYIDGADSFPRYYMNLDAAMREATDWINWRLYKIPYLALYKVAITLDFEDFEETVSQL